MQPLFHNKVNFGVYMDEPGLEATRIALGHVIPLLNGGINANLLFTIRDRFPAQFFGVKFFIVWLWNNMPPAELAEMLLEWLVTRSEDGQPRMLMLDSFNIESESWVPGLIERIRQQMINANSSASFFIWILNEELQESTTQNTGTNEQLLIRKRNDCNIVLIGRCPSNVDGQKWVEEMWVEVEEMQEARDTEQEERGIISIFDLELGQFEEAELEEQEKSEEDDVDEPGPSKQ